MNYVTLLLEMNECPFFSVHDEFSYPGYLDLYPGPYSTTILKSIICPFIRDLGTFVSYTTSDWLNCMV